MDGKRSRSTVRLLDAIAVIVLIMAALLTYMHHHVDFTNITAPFERLSSMAQEQFPRPEVTPGETQEEIDKAEAEERSDVIHQIAATAEQMRDDLGLSKAQMYYIKFKTFMENLEQRVTELPYKPLIILALLLFFAVKSFVGIVPVSATCLIAAVIFPYPVALLINFVGVGIIFTIKWAMGRGAKSNAIKKYIMRSDNLWRIVSDADNSTKKAIKESSDKRKAEKQALDALQGKNEPKPKKELHPVLKFFVAIGKGIGKVVTSIKNALLKVPVLNIAVDDEDAEVSAKGGTGNPLILFALRLIPFVPANPVSSLFGNMGMDYRSFLVISLFGYLLKVVSFTAIGYNISDPFSSKFIVPFIALLYLAGFGLLAINSFLKYAEKRNVERAKEKQTEQKAEV
ncbi:MAG: TVP38/TMEM64 family protein [Clostridia bacterium]|nr:TVP38/TMEM64 family protein [Clostridia bacterium]MBQ8926579.1 TVP38/TMEM64 family protein [Clostridia bacterium]